MTAKIGLEDVRFHAPHGFFEEEHRMGNEFSVDVEVEASIGGAAQSDDLGGTVNYATIYYLVQAEMKKPTLLLEALAYRIGSRIQNQFDSVSSVKVRLRKLNPPLGGKVGAAFVEVNLAGGGGGGGFGGGRARQDTFEDPPGFAADDDFGGTPGGGFGGMGGGGFSGGGGGISAFKKEPPPVVFDEAAFDDDFDDDFDDFEEGEFDDGDFELTPEEAAAMMNADDDGDFEEGDEVYDDEDYDEMDFDDDIDLGDFNFDDLGDLDGFNFDDLDLDGRK